jgi:hypothetical protein
MTIGVRAAGAAAAAMLTLALGACGSDSSTVAQDPGSSPAAPTSSATGSASGNTGPGCAHVWRDGVRLPHTYRGCSTAQGWVKAQVYECSDGHRIVTYAHAYYARSGRTITKSPTALADDHAFRRIMAVCGA